MIYGGSRTNDDGIVTSLSSKDRIVTKFYLKFHQQMSSCLR